MRRWEYVEGSASKFWETWADGTVVTVRYGRCGSDGRTRSKEYASAAAAAAQVLKTISEKERKGYQEVGVSAVVATPGGAAGPDEVGRAADAAGLPAAETPAGTEPAEDEHAARKPCALPDEDTFVLPAKWRQCLHPRRGGVQRAPGKAPRQVLDVLKARIAEEPAWIQEFLDAPRTDAGLAQHLRAHLAGSPSPTGAAALASVVATTQPAAWAHLWVERHGLPFAARAAMEYLLIDPHWEQRGVRRSDPWLEALAAPRNSYWANQRRPVADRVRALAAAADDATYRATVEALAGSRGDTPRKIIASFLVPSEKQWLADLWVDPEVTAEQRDPLLNLLYCTLDSPDQVGMLPRRPRLGNSLPLIATVAEGIGTAVAPLIAQSLATPSYSDVEKMVAGALVEIPTDYAFGILLDHADSKPVRASLLDAMRRYPVRALRLLAADVRARDEDEGAARSSRGLLLGHVDAHRELVTAVLPTLPEDAAELVGSLLNPVGLIADTEVTALPVTLTSPPWSRPRTASKPVVVPGLTAECEPSLTWLPGEQDAWAGMSSWYTYNRGQGDWAQDIAALHSPLDGSSLQCAWVYVYAPEELVRAPLTTWDPTDLYDGEQTLKPIAARFGLAALPLLLRAAPRHPSGLAPLLLPYVDVAVAQHMADWAFRLKSTAATARSWFVRHGAEAAPLLVPDAVGKAGTARRAAERALLLIASIHGEHVVREAAVRYGDPAAEAVGILLATDPLERALPGKLPELPVWSGPAQLPQIVARAGGALPAQTVRNALMMLALSKPGEPYPGVTALTEAAEAGSLAEFSWALFEQWRQANMPARESWALHALGLLGDDTTVRRLTPVIRAWPGESAHHRAVEGLDVLASIGTDTALLQLHGISQRVKFKALKVRAQEKIAEVASTLGLTGEQLADRLVPDFSLDADGSTVIDYGTRRFTVGFDEQLRPYVLDGDGKRRKDLPMPGARDDAELAPAERKRFMGLKKDVRTVATDQVRRLEAAMVARRSWTAREFGELFVGHPLMWHLVRRLVWLCEEEGERTAFRVAEDRTFADVEDDVFVLPEDACVRLAHPLHLGEEVTAWSEVFADYEILQPFPQLGRAVSALTEEEAAGYRLTRFEGLKVTTGKVLGLQRRGWERGVPQDAGVERWISKRLGDNLYLVIALDDGIAVGVVDMFPEQILETVWLDDRPGDHYRYNSTFPLRFDGLDPVTVSELLGDLTELTEGVGA